MDCFTCFFGVANLAVFQAITVAVFQAITATKFLEVEPFAETDEQFASCVRGNHVLFAAGHHIALLCAPLVGATALELLAAAAEPARG